MSRGRRGRRRRRPSGGAEPQEKPQPQADRPAGSRRRRRRRGTGGVSALERMVAERKTTTVTTLPPDGTVLEEVISNLQSEFGTPTTPQEFRLQVKVLGAETSAIETEPDDPQEVPEALPVTDESVAEGSEGSPTRRSGRRRRRRRPASGGNP